MSCTSIRKSDGDMERQWHQRGFMISTDHTFLNVAAINAAFASDELYWTKEMSPPILRKVISNSFCFGLYKVPENTHDPEMMRDRLMQIGFARLITDEVTFAYLTDVYVLKEYQSQGLGQWLMQCLDETLESWPDLRRAMLLTSGEKAVAFYRKMLKMEPFEQKPGGLQVLNRMGKGNFFGA